MFDTWNAVGPLANRNQDESMQSCRCPRKRGQRDAGTVCALGRRSRQDVCAPVSASARDGRQLTDPASATLPPGPRRCIAEEPGQDLTAASVKNASAHSPRRVRCNRV